MPGKELWQVALQWYLKSSKGQPVKFNRVTKNSAWMMDSTWCLIKMVIPPQESPHKEYIYPLNLKQAIGVTLPETIAAKARENGPNLPLLRKLITVQLVVRVGTLGFWASFVGTTWDRKSHQHLSQIRLPSGELTWQLKSLVFKWDIYIFKSCMFHCYLCSLEWAPLGV